MRIKRWNGSAWVDDLPTVGVSNIETSGTPSSSTFLRGDGAWATPTATDSTKLPLAGGTLTGTLTTRAINMQNYNLSGVGVINFNDPGVNEGINWSNIKLYESPDNLTNAAGNFQVATGSTRLFTVKTNGDVDIPGGSLSVSDNVTIGGYTAIHRDNRDDTYTFHDASDLAAGWYTIATNTGDRGVARFGLRDTRGGRHQSIVFYAGHAYGTDGSNVLTVLHYSNYSGSPMRYIRIKDGGTYDGAALQVYIDDSTNTVRALMLGDNFQSSGWVLKDWIADATDPGDLSNYSSFTEASRIDLDQIAQGGMATTGPIYAGGDTTQYRVLTTNDEGSGNGIDADTVDGIEAGSFLRSNADDIYTGTLTLGTNTTIKLPNSASYGIRTSTGHRVIDSVDATLRIGDTGKHSLITLHGQDADDFKVYYGATHYTLYHEGNKPSAGDVGAAAASHTHSDLVAVSGDTMTGDLTMQKDGTTDVGSHGVVFQANTSLGGVGDFTRELNIDSAGNLNYNGNTIFHEGNDGSASGLHADLLDGQQGSHYLDYNNFTNTPTIPTNNNQLTNGAGYVTGSHSHSTSNITSGEFNTARLGSGTATSGYVLQSDGDGTASWAAASGGAEPEWEYVAKVSGANPLTYSSMDALSNYEYKFVIEVVTTAEDTSNPYIRINNDSTAGETSYQYTRVQQTSSTGETETHSGSASSNLIYTGLALSSYSNGGTMVSTVHNSEFIYTISPYSSSPGIYTGIVDGWGSTHYSSQSGTSYDGMVQSRFTGRKRGIYQTEANRIDYYHDITAGSTDYSEMRVYRRPKK